MRAQIAGPHEFDVRHFDGDVGGHRAFRYQHNLLGPVGLDPINHFGRRTGKVGGLDDIRRALRMRNNFDTGFVCAQGIEVSASESLVDFA